PYCCHTSFLCFISMYLFFLFFFNSYVPLRDLPSFPTRRSSDLDVDLEAELVAEQPPQLHDVEEDGAVLHRADEDRHAPPVAGREDRKSTRLNSSHVAISYAVFCLKKKKKKKRKHTREQQM